eukprot:tig00020685_g12919.t1
MQLVDWAVAALAMGAYIARRLREGAGGGQAERELEADAGGAAAGAAALSDDVLRLVFAHLSDDAQSLLAASQACRRWRGLLSPEDAAWRAALGRQWGEAAAVHAAEAEGGEGPLDRSWRTAVGGGPGGTVWKARALARGRAPHAHHDAFQAELARACGRLAGFRLRLRLGPAADDEGRPEDGCEADCGPGAWRAHADSVYASFPLPAPFVQSPAFRSGGLLRGALYPLPAGGAPLPPAAAFSAPVYPGASTAELCRGDCSGALVVSGDREAEAATVHLSAHGHLVLRALRGEAPPPAAPLPPLFGAAAAEDLAEAIAAGRPGDAAPPPPAAPGPAACAAGAGARAARLAAPRLAARAAAVWGYTLYLAFRPDCGAAAAAGGCGWAAGGWSARLRLADALFSYDLSSYLAWRFEVPAEDAPRAGGAGPLRFPFGWHLRDATLYGGGGEPLLLSANAPVVVSGPGPGGAPVFAGTFFLRVDAPASGPPSGAAPGAWWARTVAAVRYEWDAAAGAGAGALCLELRAMPALVHALIAPPGPRPRELDPELEA